MARISPANPGLRRRPPRPQCRRRRRCYGGGTSSLLALHRRPRRGTRHLHRRPWEARMCSMRKARNNRSLHRAKGACPDEIRQRRSNNGGHDGRHTREENLGPRPHLPIRVISSDTATTTIAAAAVAAPLERPRILHPLPPRSFSRRPSVCRWPFLGSDVTIHLRLSIPPLSAILRGTACPSVPHLAAIAVLLPAAFRRVLLIIFVLAQQPIALPWQHRPCHTFQDDASDRCLKERTRSTFPRDGGGSNGGVSS